MREVGAGGVVEHHARQVRRSAVARRGIAELAGVRLAVGHQLLDVLRGNGRVHHQHVRQVADLHHRREALDRVVADLLVQADVDGQRPRGPEQQHVAIGRRAGHRFGAQVAAGAGLVLDDHRLAQLDRRGQRACHRVGGAARGKGHDHHDRLGREIVGLRHGRQAKRGRSRAHQGEGLHACLRLW
jgi:hypothetical protein